MKNNFNKALVMTRENDGDFENCTKCWISDNTYVDGDVKVNDHCHIIAKYRGSAYRKLQY